MKDAIICFINASVFLFPNSLVRSETYRVIVTPITFSCLRWCAAKDFNNSALWLPSHLPMDSTLALSLLTLLFELLY